MKNGTAIQNNVFKVYDSDTNKALDGTVTVQLPSFELASNTFKGAGVGAEINVPAPGVMNALVATISVPIIYGELTKYLELASTKTLDLRNEIVLSNKDSHQIEKAANRWVLKGPLSKADPGKIEQGATSDATFDLQIYYVHHWLDGDDVLEWDPFKFIYKVNGQDMMSDTRQNILVG